MKEITALIPNNQVIEYPETGDKIFLKDKEYTATCGGLFGESTCMIPVEWVDFTEINERLPMHDFLNCFIYSKEEARWVIRPNLEELLEVTPEDEGEENPA